MSGVQLGFSLKPLSVKLANILPARKVPEGLFGSQKFRQIRSSIEAVGMIEPLSVTAAAKDSGCHILLDGHIRFVALHDLGYDEAQCLIAKDDEGYTYNNRINRLSTIQEHFMLRRAIDRGVSPDRLAAALSVDVRTISKKLSLLEGICPEAAEILKDRQFSSDVSRVLRKMRPTRQVECVELMVSANTITVAYAEAMLIATPTAQLVEGKKPQRAAGVSAEQMARMEREMSHTQEQYKLAEQQYGLDVLNLVLARGFLKKLIGNQAVSRYLLSRQPEVLSEFEAIVRTVSLES